jgi:hypothetical protein
MATSEPGIEVTYRSGISNSLGPEWDILQVAFSNEGQVMNSFLIARTDRGHIIRKTDLILDRWEVVTTEVDLRDFQHCFDERDRLQYSETR